MTRNYGWVIVAAGAVITCVAMGAMFALPVYLAPIAAETGWSRAGISMAMTVGFIVMGVAGFGWGTLSDRIGARPVVLVAALLGGGGLILASRTTDLLVFQFAYGGLIGAAGGAFFAPIISATVSWFDKNRALAISLVSAGIGVAPMTVSPFARYLITTYEWRPAMLMIGLFAWAVLLPAGLFVRNAPPQTEPGGAPVSQGDPWATAKRAFRTPQFLVLAGTFAALYAVALVSQAIDRHAARVRDAYRARRARRQALWQARRDAEAARAVSAGLRRSLLARWRSPRR